MKKKKVVKKAVKKAKKKPVKKTAKKKVTQKAAKVPVVKKSEGKLIGQVTHYFPHVNAIAVKIRTGDLKLGDTVHIKGHTSDFKIQIVSMQLDHKSVGRGKKGDEVGIQAPERAREGDEVYKL